MSSLQEQLQKDRACRQLRLQRDNLEKEAKFWHKCFEDKQKEADLSKRLAQEEQRWSKRKVDDARASAETAWTVAAEADKRAMRAERTQRLQQYYLTRVERPAVPRDDLLPPSQTPTPKPSQKPPPSRASKEARQARNKDRKALQRENKRNGKLEREQLRRAQEEEGAVGGYS